MEVTTAQAGYGTVDSTGETDLLNGNSCMSLWIKCGSNSANDLLVSCSEVHGTSFFKLEPGDAVVLRSSSPSNPNKIATVAAKALDGTGDATISWCVAGAFL